MHTRMPFEIWLKSLPEGSTRYVQDDLATLDYDNLPFLEIDSARYQVERLSLHLGKKPAFIRKAVIRYSLYVRQLDAIQEQQHSIRQMCAHHCPRPPVGCCNGEHFIILSFSDIMFAGIGQDALHLAHILTAMQVKEHNHALQQGRTVQIGYCSRLTTTGCSLRMFKSPRCIHYLCPDVMRNIAHHYGDNSLLFLNEMKTMSSQVVVGMSDFMSPRVISAAESLFNPEI